MLNSQALHFLSLKKQKFMLMSISTKTRIKNKTEMSGYTRG